MAPMFGEANYDFLQDSREEVRPEDDGLAKPSLTEMAFWYMILLLVMLLTWLIVFFCLRMFALRQKTHSPQERRGYAGTRARPSFQQPDPIIYVSPANLPPPPKYEAMAPPSYEEVVGVHYPNYQVPVTPITQPISNALAQGSGSTSNNITSNTVVSSNTIVSSNNNSNVNTASDNNACPTTVVRVTDDRRTSVVITASA